MGMGMGKDIKRVETPRTKLSDEMADTIRSFSYSEVAYRGNWYFGHLNKWFNFYKHIEVGNTVRQLVDYDGDKFEHDVVIEKIEMVHSSMSDIGGIMVHVSGDYSPVYYWELKEIKK